MWYVRAAERGATPSTPITSVTYGNCRFTAEVLRWCSEPAVSDGIPGAIQIAGRFHLVMNCGVNVIRQMRRSLKDIKDEIFAVDGTELMDVHNVPTERIRARYRAVKELTNKGMTQVAIASLIGMKEETVRQLQSMPAPHGYAKALRSLRYRRMPSIRQSCAYTHATLIMESTRRPGNAQKSMPCTMT